MENGFGEFSESGLGFLNDNEVVPLNYNFDFAPLLALPSSQERNEDLKALLAEMLNSIRATQCNLDAHKTAFNEWRDQMMAEEH